LGYMYACFITFFFSLSWGLLSAPNLAQGMNFTCPGVPGQIGP